MVCVRKCLLSALRACGSLWGAESLLRERIPLQNFPLVGETHITPPAKGFPLCNSNHLMDFGVPAVRFLLNHIFAYLPVYHIFLKKMFTVFSTFQREQFSSTHTHARTPPRKHRCSSRRQRGPSRQGMEAGDAVVALAEHSRAFPQTLPPARVRAGCGGQAGTSRPGNHPPGTAALPERRILLDVIYSRAELHWRFSEPSHLQPRTGGSPVYKLAPQVSSQ